MCCCCVCRASREPREALFPSASHSHTDSHPLDPDSLSLRLWPDDEVEIVSQVRGCASRSALPVMRRGIGRGKKDAQADDSDRLSVCEIVE